MTKKDGDKLRKMSKEINDIESQYERDSLTRRDLAKVRDAIYYTLAARPFEVKQK